MDFHSIFLFLTIVRKTYMEACIKYFKLVNIFTQKQTLYQYTIHKSKKN